MGWSFATSWRAKIEYLVGTEGKERQVGSDSESKVLFQSLEE